MDLALATAAEKKVGILVINEPNKKMIEGRRDWLYDNELNTAIKVIDSKIVVKEYGKREKFSFVATPSFTVYSCYASPNKGTDDLDNLLQQIGDSIHSRGEEAIVTGDFNAKSPQWGMDKSDRRGGVVAEWVAQNDLIIQNKGSKPTFERNSYGSILDLTITTPCIGRSVSQWEVIEEETLSDHNYIIFQVVKKIKLPRKFPRARWNTRKLNKENLIQAIEEITVGKNPPAVDKFASLLENLCKKCMTKSRPVCRGQPVYWWNEEIAMLRKECIRKRRIQTRAAKRNSSSESQRLLEDLKRSKKELRNSIKKAKRESWKAVCDEINRDIWGRGYGIVMKRVIGHPPRPRMTMLAAESAARHLFPMHKKVDFELTDNWKFLEFTKEELAAACARLKNNKAPGPGNIPSEIVKQMALRKPEYVLNIYNKLATQGEFPKRWKRANLVLVRKGDQPIEDPGSYRPICLLEAEGKLFEHLILGRLKKEIVRTGDLASNQYGFREGRQTVDAIRKVIAEAKQAAAFSTRQRRLCAVITIDVRNAFNSASWQSILDEMRKRKLDESIITIVASYLSDREIILEAEDAYKIISVNSGVPQGSVLGPTLWNVQYNDLLEMEMPNGIKLIGFADDLAIVVVARSEEILMTLANIAIQKVSQWMKNKNLKLAPEKTQAVILTKKRKMDPIQFNVEGHEIKPGKSLKYLGVWLDTKSTFDEHIQRTTIKADKTMTALASLMPNVDGPKASKRRILVSVILSQLLYAAPVWCEATQKTRQRKRLMRTQRVVAIRVCSAYRTVSAEGIGVIAGLPPIDLLVQERAEVYEGRQRLEARNHLMNKWQAKWDAGTHGRWTWRLIPNIEKWTKRKYGEVDYFLTQALSGHGCFREYLFNRKRSETDKCPYCSAKDDAEHTLFVCERWKEERDRFKDASGKAFNMDNMMNCLVQSKEGWVASYDAIRQIIKTKEREGRELKLK